MLTNAVDLPMDEREEDCLDSIHAAADQVRAALQQPAVQPEGGPE